jgi:hypothetical protein
MRREGSHSSAAVGDWGHAKEQYEREHSMSVDSNSSISSEGSDGLHQERAEAIAAESKQRANQGDAHSPSTSTSFVASIPSTPSTSSDNLPETVGNSERTALKREVSFAADADIKEVKDFDPESTVSTISTTPKPGEDMQPAPKILKQVSKVEKNRSFLSRAATWCSAGRG